MTSFKYFSMFVFDIDSCVNMADRYETVLHPVASGQVQFPTHVKRFEMQMFAFMQQNVILKDQVMH